MHGLVTDRFRAELEEVEDKEISKNKLHGRLGDSSMEKEASTLVNVLGSPCYVATKVTTLRQ